MALAMNMVAATVVVLSAMTVGMAATFVERRRHRNLSGVMVVLAGGSGDGCGGGGVAIERGTTVSPIEDTKAIKQPLYSEGFTHRMNNISFWPSCRLKVSQCGRWSR
ncbi:alcohol dehydrogenase superfamilyzinc-containing [Striga asiatica]|uniref:Alcohol dehydrogenase superfamilyzinc-containing n=1 Tax=Striga asiatica TaxID=4170 RepID=A0A5A7PVL6_STRAF|nr:alcohol dehydrogenase superfamilyzinc-containing [Striga asiatica]